MATVTLTWSTGRKTSFETADPKVIARYRVYAQRDPGITKISVRYLGDPDPEDDTST